MILTLALASAQTQLQTPPETVIRINVNLVQVDATVTDGQGKPVTDLKAGDFQILQDGKPQVITNFTYVNLRPGAAPAPPARVSVANGSTPGPPPPPTRISLDKVRRTVALVVDDLGLSFASIAYVRTALKKFVDQEMQPGDLVAIIRTGAGIGALQQFTADKRQLYAAIDRVKFNAIGRVGVSSFEPLGSDSGDAGIDQERASVMSAGTLGAIRYVVNGLHELTGRKSVVLFSENLKLFNSDGMDQRVMDEVRRLTDAANRASVVIYSIDPRGLQYYGITAADNTSGMNARQISEVASNRSQEVFNSQDGMALLATQTGGLFVHDNNDISGALRKVIQDSEGYYLIGYHPEAATFDVKSGLPKFHRVQVKVIRPGLHVRSRNGFFGTSDREATPTPRTPQQQILHALTSPFDSGSIHMRLTGLFSYAPKTGSYLNSMLYIDAKDLKFEDEADDWHKAVLEIVAVTFGDNGQPVDTTAKTYTMRIKGEAYQQALKTGFVYTMHHVVKKPGAYQMRVALRDDSSEQLGSASQFVEVPDVHKGRLTLSSLVIKEDAEIGQPQKQDDNAEGQNTENPNGSPAVRIFRRGKGLVYLCQVLNAQLGTGSQPNLELHTRLFHDGKQIYEGKPMPLDMRSQTDPKHLIAAGEMKLGAGMEAGDYVLQVIVTDKLAKDKYATTTQSMDFELQ
ncbi:MAG TPA: VWA domain-containing protein [Candidatus Sulfopaludibacter sp.]|nr:VWA domain-containing protein [Candidatus Sulfopaludibacter sp.]